MDNSRQPIGLNPFTQVNDFYASLVDKVAKSAKSLNPFTQVNDFYNGIYRSLFYNKAENGLNPFTQVNDFYLL